MVTRDIIEEYTKYIDPSEMIIEYYKNQTTAGLEKYFLQIEDWLSKDLPPENNKPLIIQADEGVGKKTLLVQWMKYHQQKSQKNFPDLTISHFAGTDGNNQNYFYAIYKILVRLREHFNISQKVELLENKLESYFHYWLEVCSRALAARIVDDSTIVLIFEGINLFKDPDTKEEANVGLWLPKTFPNRIRVIITAESESQALQYFESIGCDMITIQEEPIVHSTLVNYVLGRESFVIDEDYRKKVIQILNTKPQEVVNNSLFVKTYISTLLPYPSDAIIKADDIIQEDFKTVFQKMDFKKLEGINDINELNLFILDYFSMNIMDFDKFKGVLVALNITEKGLSENEIFMLTGATTKEWNSILAVFKTFMMKYRDLWKINNETFKKAIRQKYQDEPGYTTQLHTDIADILNRRTPNSIRKLEEETYHLFMSRNYFKLKEAVANIENFLLLFNPNNKYDLCRYWQILEQRGFDPAAEYTKAVEGFELHYRPNQEDTFMIILQVSRFLKEFSDFETNVTPEFRHPPIKGGTELKEIGLRREIKKLNMYQPEEWEAEDETLDELDELEHKLTKEFPDYPEATIKEMVQQIHSATHPPKQQAPKQVAKQPEQKDKPQEGGEAKPVEEVSQVTEKKGGKLRSLALGGGREKKNELFLLNPMEALNVDIPDNREKFKAYFMETLQGKEGDPNKENKEGKDSKENKDRKKKGFLDEDEVVSPTKKDETQDQKSNLKGKLAPPLAEEGKKVEGKEVVKAKRNITEDRGIEFIPTFYYYKRWLWIMFPWVCLSSKKDFNFSKVIYECFSSATEYISVAEEREKTRQALKIAIEAKLKKQSVYATKDMSQSTTKLRHDLSVGKSNRKILPPIAGKDKDALFDTSNSQTMRLDTLSPVHGKPINKKMLNNTQKDAKFFITSEYLTPHYIGDVGNTTMEPSMIGKASIGNTSFQSMSLMNKTGRDKSMSNLASNRKVEEMLRNANEAIQTLMLPKYQDSLLSTSGKQVDDLESKVKLLQSQFDELAYQNKMSAKKLKDLSIVETNLRGEGGVDVVAKAQGRMGELSVEIEKANKLKSDAVSQGERLSKIILVCVKNKSQNVLGVQSLNYLLNNFKKIIDWEKDDTNETLKNAVDLEKMSKQYLKAYQERLKQQERAVQHVRKEKMTSLTMERQLENVYDTMEKTAILANEEMKTKQIKQKEAAERKQKMETMKDKNKNAKESVDEMREMYEQVEKVIGLDFESAKFQGFLDYMEKMNDFQRSLYEQKDENAKLREEKMALSSYLETLKKAKSSGNKQGERKTTLYIDLNDKDKLVNILTEKRKDNEAISRDVAKQTQLLLNSKMSLERLCKELNVPIDTKSISELKLPTEEILKKLEEKMKVMKETMPAEEFEKFQKGETDLNALLKSQVVEIPPKKRGSQKLGEEAEGDEDLPSLNVFKKGSKILESKME